MSAPVHTTLCVMRHGQTEWNAQKRIQGHLDTPLSDTGRRQAEALAAQLAAEPFVAVYSSDLQRARDTAAPLAARLGLTVHTEPDLREWHLGDLQGLSHDEVRAAFGAQIDRVKRFDPDFAPPGGESYRAFVQRSMTVLGVLAARHAGARIAVVSHGGVIIGLLRDVHRVPPDEPRLFPIPNVGVVRVRHTREEGRDVWHLAEDAAG